MDIDDLYAFVTIVREKSISKASRTLHLTQPTLTARLKKMERELGVHLLERSWNGVTLTEDGTFFFVSAVKIIREIDDMMTQFRRNNGP